MDTLVVRGISLESLVRRFLLISALLVTFPASSAAGPYPPAADEPGSTAVSKNDPALVAWATGWECYYPGDEVSVTWKTPEKGLGAAQGTSFHIVSLGRGGSITLTFALPIRNSRGWDFAVFENAFNDTNLELGYVEVSSNGKDFLRFDNDSLTPEPVGGYGAVDPTDIEGLAGKYIQGFGTPFDLQDLATKDEVLDGAVNLGRIACVRIVDVIGDGTYFDTGGDAIYDPYPTVGSAGFDLDAIGVRHENTKAPGENRPPEQPSLSLPEDGATDVALTSMLVTEPFADPDEGDSHFLTRWQVSDEPDFSNILLDEISGTHLTKLTLPLLLLDEGVPYYWRVRFSDDYGAESLWSDAYSFTTAAEPLNAPPDQPALSLPENDATDIPTTPTLETEAFFDPDEGDSHELTVWQISSQADFSAIVFEQTSSIDLTSASVPPKSELAYTETYYWRVQFYDNHGAESVWSDAFVFTTKDPPKSGKAGVSGNGCYISALLLSH
jgi:hypothetical protein